ncbi:hypothetical protein MHM84_03550 [Halomonas sp. McH1-25]|uniref:hypothetical protein n=1 Tax=unclassified Halomonas TaxID=2609666 RepID=UPI001EF58790|nr:MULTISPECIES: hypothetical protein [unclassified Halomonas]MCG7598847.1 hypothetical protein [Halomonas sp. McH1-25]MCP1340810.1 hypothetical protein [Halomonas sp. FL8]MCP1361307.1 hypothetical protein [Halomonas sp. BBD45]
MPLTKQDAEQLLEQLYATAEVLGSEIKPGAANLMVRDLREYSRQEVEKALARCRSELTGRLTLAAILDRIPGANAFLSPNEAWALALSSLDENETVVWTKETAEAMGVAQPILDVGDKVGARMAFIAAYERKVEEAKTEQRKPEWQVSLGYSPERRQEAISEAVKKGLLPAPKVEHLLPAPVGFDEDTAETPEEAEKRKENIRHLRSLLNSIDEEKDRAEQERVHQIEERRKEMLAQADELKRRSA